MAAECLVWRRPDKGTADSQGAAERPAVRAPAQVVSAVLVLVRLLQTGQAL